MDNKGPDQTVWMYRLVWVFIVHIGSEVYFLGGAAHILLVIYVLIPPVFFGHFFFLFQMNMFLIFPWSKKQITPKSNNPSPESNFYKDLINLTTLWANSVDDKLVMFFLFFQKTGFDISCKLSPLETICMKCQILFSGNIFFKMSSAESFIQSANSKQAIPQNQIQFFLYSSSLHYFSPYQVYRIFSMLREK